MHIYFVRVGQLPPVSFKLRWSIAIRRWSIATRRWKIDSHVNTLVYTSGGSQRKKSLSRESVVQVVGKSSKSDPFLIERVSRITIISHYDDNDNRTAENRDGNLMGSGH